MGRPPKASTPPPAPGDTPLMRQYTALKARHPGTLLLFRMGDFYETFGEDAVVASRILGITLTRRANGAASEVELAGFPYHALDNYLPRLVKAGQRVAVCEQLEDPRLAKGLVKRGVTEIVTPGTALADPLLSQKQSNYLAALHLSGPRQAALALIEVSTGACLVWSTESAPSDGADVYTQLDNWLSAYAPSEVLIARKDLRAYQERWGQRYYHTRLEDWLFSPEQAHEALLRHFGASSLKALGLNGSPDAALVAGVLLLYLRDTAHEHLGHIRRIAFLDDGQHLLLDASAVRSLEILQPLQPDGRALVDVLDHTLTPMGGRLLRQWLVRPLRHAPTLHRRHQAVGQAVAQGTAAHDVRQRLRQMNDLERLAGKLALQRLHPRDASALRQSVGLLPALAELMVFMPDAAEALAKASEPLAPAHALLCHTLADNCSGAPGSGQVVRPGVMAELDHLRQLQTDTQGHLEALRLNEAARTGISSLKVGYTRVFGYYLEVTHAHRDRVPPDYQRKQTLAGAERYITPELKQFEEQLLHAEERIATLEVQAYQQLIDALQAYIAPLQTAAQLVAEVDVLLALAETARMWHYCAPAFTEAPGVELVQARHPVIEQSLPAEQPYIPNDLTLDPQRAQLLLITGPNMAGKSALLRQTALIALMAQVGSYVPAQSATLGLVDQIYTRVGASDNLAAGESTFMVEMQETARILHGCTPRSLVLLDEVGRGTSTYDGVAIAWALVEALHEDPERAPLTLFATHYHELAQLAQQLPRVKNMHMAVQESQGRVVFLRRLAPGSTNRSFGIHVAEMAGMPHEVTQRAAEILQQLESRHAEPSPRTKLKAETTALALAQLKLFPPTDARMDRIKRALEELDAERMAPIEALLKLQQLKVWLQEPPQ